MSENVENSFSFAGCGFLGIYHIGVAVCLRRHVPHMLRDAKFYGASAGAMIACCLMCEVPMNECVDFTLRLANNARTHTLGGFHPDVKINTILQNALEEVLPNNAHIVCSGRLFISVTHWFTKKNVIISEFDSRHELIEALMMSAFVPIFSGVVPPQYKGEYYIDGGLSNNLPLLDKHTVLVSPFAGECDICPRDEASEMIALTLANTSMQCSLNNLGRLMGALFPPSPGQLKDMCWAGFDDTVRYLSEHNLIRCEEHIIHSHLQQEKRKNVHCSQCRRRIYYAHIDKLPENIASMLSLPHVHSNYEGPTLLEEGWSWTQLLFSKPVKALLKINVPIRVAFELWFTAMIRCVAKVASVGKSLCTTGYRFNKISFDTAWDLIRRGMHFLLASPVYHGSWCEGHEGETYSYVAENGESRRCKICKRPRIFGARTRLPSLPLAEEEVSLPPPEDEVSVRLPLAADQVHLPPPAEDEDSSPGVQFQFCQAPRPVSPLVQNLFGIQIPLPPRPAGEEPPQPRPPHRLPVRPVYINPMPDDHDDDSDYSGDEDMAAASCKHFVRELESGAAPTGPPTGWEFTSGVSTPAHGASSEVAKVKFKFSMDITTHIDVQTDEPPPAQWPLETIEEMVEELHVDNIVMEPDVLGGQAGGELALHVGQAEAGSQGEAEDQGVAPTVDITTPCPQALDSFEACLEAMENMDAILTMHFLGDDHLIHSETIYGLPVHSEPTECSHTMSEVDVEEQEEQGSLKGVDSIPQPQAQQEASTLDEAVSRSTVVRHELMDIIQNKILQQEMEMEERHRLALRLHGMEPEDHVHFSLQLSGRLDVENLPGSHSSLNTAPSGTSLDSNTETSASPHFLRSVSDASALASELQALRQNTQAQQEAKRGSKSGSSTPHRLEAALSGRRTLDTQRLTQSLLSLTGNGQQAITAPRERLVRAKSDCCGLASKLRMMKKQEESLNHAMSADTVGASTSNAKQADEKPPSDPGRNFVTETSRSGMIMSRAKRRRMNGKFSDERFSRSQPSLDTGFTNAAGAAASPEPASPLLSARQGSNFHSEPCLTGTGSPSVPRKNRASRAFKSVSQTQSQTKASPESKNDSTPHPCYEEFGKAMSEMAATSPAKETTEDNSEGATGGARPRLVRSRSLMKSQDALQSLRSDLESIKLDNEQSGSSQPAAIENNAHTDTSDGQKVSGSQKDGSSKPKEKKKDEKDSCSGHAKKKSGDHKTCRTS